MNQLHQIVITFWRMLLSPATGLIAVLAFTFGLYAPSLNDWFFADDFWFLRRSESTGWDIWLPRAFDFRSTHLVPEFNEYRPLYLITFKVEYLLFGLNAAPYHVFNVAVHLGCVALFWLLARRLTGRVWAAHLAALIFGVHFAYGDAVRWVANGNTPLATLFYLAAFLFFIKSTDSGPRRYLYYGGFLAAFAAALLCHAVTMPLFVALVAWYFLMHRKPLDALKPASWLVFVPVLFVLVPYVLIQQWVHQNYPNLSIGFQIGWHMYDIYVDYFSISAYPVDLQDSTSPYVSAVMFCFCGFLLTQWRWSPLAPFAVIWYITAIAPDSLLIFGAFGRLLYLPGLPLALVVTAVAMRLYDLVMSDGLRAVAAPIRSAAPYVGIVMLVLGALLVWKLQDIASKTGPAPDDTIAKQAAANHHMLSELRSRYPTLPEGGVLYIANPPFNLVIFSDDPLANMVKLYYDGIEVKAVPMRVPPFWTVDQARAALRPEDRLFINQPAR